MTKLKKKLIDWTNNEYWQIGYTIGCQITAILIVVVMCILECTGKVKITFNW